jgi:hypothetical protein
MTLLIGYRISNKSHVQADQLLIEQANERDQKRIDRTTKEKL